MTKIIEQKEIIKIACNYCSRYVDKVKDSFGGIEVIGQYGSIFEKDDEYSMHFCNDNCLLSFMKEEVKQP